MPKVFNRILCVLLILIPVAVIASTQGRQFNLEWHNPQRIFVGKEDTADLLSFDGAIYGDSLQGIPAFTYSVRNQTPLFITEFGIVNKKFAPASLEESQILESEGFFSTEIEISQGQKFTRKESWSVLTFYPFRKNPEIGIYEKLISFELTEKQVFTPEVFPASMHQYPTHSVLATGSWFKICVDQSGVYQLTYNDLVEMGVNMQGLPRANIRLFGNGGGMLPEANSANRNTDLLENAVFVSGHPTGIFSPGDYILFYGDSPNQWVFNSSSKVFEHQIHLYAQETCYFLTTDRGSGLRMQVEPNLPAEPTHQVSNFQDFVYHHKDQINLIESGREWYGEVFDATLTRQFNFSFPNLVTQVPARLRAHVAARSSANSSFSVNTGGGMLTLPVSQIFPAHFIGAFANPSEQSLWFNPNQTSQIPVTVTYNRPNAEARGWLNFLELNVTRLLIFVGPQMHFRNVNIIGQGNIAQYSLSNASAQVVIWDVTDNVNVKIQETVLNGNTMHFRQHATGLRQYIAFDGSNFLRPRRIGRIPNQNLHGTPVADLTIIVPEAFRVEAERLGEFRRVMDRLRVTVVTTNQVYNEFSSGTPDIGAIRNFMKMFFDRAQNQAQLPRYLLLFGNGTFDNRNILGFGGNFIPTFQSQNSLQYDRSFMTDDFFGLLDDNEGLHAEGNLDIGIGRLPVRTIEEARDVVEKLIRYQKPETNAPNLPGGMPAHGLVNQFADWRNKVVFIADDQDFNRHFIDSEILAGIMESQFPEFNIEKIYFDAFPQLTLAGGVRYPDVNRSINEAVNQGALLINYIGHGGTTGLAHERVLTFSDIASWNNYYNLPVFMTATCEFSRFDNPDPDQNSAGVRIFLKPGGGAIALFTTTRLAWSGPNMTLNRNFIDAAFEQDSQGNFNRLGEIIRLSKVRSTGHLETWRISNFVLLGDPSMLMAHPRYQVITESMPDTIKAFQTVTVNGYIADATGNPLLGLNGFVYPTVFDKKSVFTTLGQDNDSFRREFFLRDNLIYRGKASVENGRFSFQFNVPANITYSFGEGRISYYFYDGDNDGNGYFHDFVIGGTYQGFTTDNSGPEIKLFLNDTTFVSGGTTNQNPILVAILSDESGINISGRVGHDIVAFINNDTSQPFLLNNFFQNHLDDFTTGSVIYPFYRLPDGHHTLTLRAWDTHNNPSVKSIEFIVSSTATLALNNLLNYPNPFSHETFFRFTHNQPFTDLNVRIDIYDLRGKLVQYIETRLNTPGFLSPSIRWDGKGLDGNKVGNGIYLYRLAIQTPDGNTSVLSQKLVILR
ncbi:MAG TPA: type IX secretion system sortase PorU [Bacteroidales bacterium]|nr:type IX secretion system sortase PorU [Bacteroidales bacterium]